MFGRKSDSPSPSSETVEAESTPLREGSKGRPTPTRREAEAARLAKARKPRTRREAAAAARARRFESSSKLREAMKTGDERFLPARDKGPVRRFARDYVDSKFTIAELLLPLLVITLILGVIGGSNTDIAAMSNSFMMLMLLVTAVNLVLMSAGLKRQVARRFPDASRKGLTYYACMRMLQLRILRMPKVQVRIGEQLPETYR